VTDRVVDRDYLTGVQYASDANLAARQAIYRFLQPPIRVVPWAIDLADLRGDERVLDVGCGNGLYIAELGARGHRGPVIAMDLSAGMLGAAQRRSPTALVVADAQQLPFGESASDCVLAMHMLYHVPDRNRAVAELRRVLAPGGVALVLTNAEAHLEELNSLISTAGGARPFARAYLRFSAESGASELEAHFASVERHDARSQLVVTDAQAVVDYAASGWAVAAATDDSRQEILGEIERRTLERIRVDGALRIRTEVACFVCR
jgi:ubiquinone/menaquinone biosynthesis C-methylase UbiE